MSDFYDWEKTISYDAEITMVIGARGIGKTFGIRKKAIQLYLNKGYRFVEVCRYKNELDDMTRGYFDRLSKLPEFNGYYFRSDTRYGYIGKKVLEDGDKKEKIIWELICYFIPLSGSQKMKKKTFDNVRYIIFDECVLDKSDRYHHYLPHEFNTLANVVDTVSRERADTDSIKPRIFLLGNACDISNPYMVAFNVGVDLNFGYRWYSNKKFLLHYVKDDEYSKRKSEETVAGHMYQISGDEIATGNIFNIGTNDFIQKKTPKSVFDFGIVYLGEKYGVWADYNIGLYFINRRIPNNTERPIFSLTLEDNRVNYIAARKASKVLQDFSEMHYYGILRYENAEIKNNFARVLTLLGIK